MIYLSSVYLPSTYQSVTYLFTYLSFILAFPSEFYFKGLNYYHLKLKKKLRMWICFSENTRSCNSPSRALQGSWGWNLRKQLHLQPRSMLLFEMLPPTRFSRLLQPGPWALFLSLLLPPASGSETALCFKDGQPWLGRRGTAHELNDRTQEKAGVSNPIQPQFILISTSPLCGHQSGGSLWLCYTLSTEEDTN